MAPLLTKYAYLQSLAKKICSQPRPELQKRKSAGKTRVLEAAGLLKKERKKALKKSQEREEKAAEAKARGPAESLRASLPALDVLRQRLPEKTLEARGQDGAKELSPAVLEKRRLRKCRKQERDRKEKQQQKELRAKRKAPEAPEGAEHAERS
ncbi:hypothetical protein EI555_020566 [Monodon monoceros]|uniref:Surfeit locus protein 6 n=1 Tax=Monodon monoceros TaxID=40151 RepID=A0A4U1ETI1_MONMO|nr:hypothetical protein EI555_020566 [Monodon monoceros]